MIYLIYLKDETVRNSNKFPRVSIFWTDHLRIHFFNNNMFVPPFMLLEIFFLTILSILVFLWISSSLLNFQHLFCFASFWQCSSNVQRFACEKYLYFVVIKDSSSWNLMIVKNGYIANLSICWLLLQNFMKPKIGEQCRIWD